jgi:hypothetical protein
MRRLLRPCLRLLILLALVFLFEAWLWEHRAPVVGWVVARIPLRQIKAWIAAWIEHLPPAATLVVFVVPVMLLLPLKFLGLWMLARGFWLGALGVLALRARSSCNCPGSGGSTSEWSHSLLGRTS